SLHDSMAIQAGHYIENGTIEEFRQAVRKALKGQQTFHWSLEFPEVFQKRGGFDALVWNPPFKGGSHLMTLFGLKYREHLVQAIAEGRTGIRGQADLCVYFLLRAIRVLRPVATLSLVCSNTAIEGDSFAVGLGHILANGATVYQGQTSTPWPGA